MLAKRLSCRSAGIETLYAFASFDPWQRSQYFGCVLLPTKTPLLPARLTQSAQGQAGLGVSCQPLSCPDQQELH